MHGRLPADEKDAAMAAFRAGEIDVLVCTTVIEVGVDVPNATVMFVMDADRFGISQLHQLRGRIGRGEHASLCLLATRLPEDSKAGERLKAVASTLDGFELADLDLAERREGDVLGYSQSGRAITLRFLSLFEHREIIEEARDFCQSHYPKRPGRSRNGASGSTVHRHRARRIPGQVMSRKRLAWLALAVVLAVAVACQTVASASHRAALFVAQADVPRVAAGVDVLAGLAQIPLRTRGFDYRRAAFGDSWTDENPRSGGHNGCDTRNDILDRDLVDKAYVSIKRCPNAVATGTLHDPYTNEFVAFVRGNRTGASVQIDHIVPLALAWDLGPATGRTTCVCGSPTIRRISLRWREQPTRTRAIPNRRCGCRPTSPSAASTPWLSSRCFAAMLCPSTRRRPWCCAMPRRPARRVESSYVCRRIRSVEALWS